MKSIEVIDSHTGGEPTRVVPIGQIEILGDSMADRRECLRSEQDWLRTGLVLEPRGYDAVVAAILTPPVSKEAVAGVVFCNNVSYLGMCGHGTIGVIETLRHLGQIGPGRVVLDTPVGPVGATLLENGEVEVQNVASRLFRSEVELKVESIGSIKGEVAFGGNWFFLCEMVEQSIEVSRCAELTDLALRIREALEQQRITGEDGAEIDHVEISGAGTQPGANSRNFVLCPGSAYDRSPCGTGTSAKLAALVTNGKLKPGEWYVQESVTGTRFRGKIDLVDGEMIPTIVGRAYVTAETKLLFNQGDPLRWGVV